MSGRGSAPSVEPRIGFAERILARSVPRQVVVRSILGDLHEGYEARRRRGVVRARAWFWLQVLLIAADYRRGRRGNELGPLRGPGDRPERRAPAYLDELRQDLRQALRGLRRRPGFSGMVVVTLALGIGANAAMFGLVSRLLLSNPPHVRDADSLVRVRMQIEDSSERSYEISTVSYPVLVDIQESGAFAALAGIRRDTAIVGEGVTARRVQSAAVTGQYFEALGTTALHGRLLGSVDDQLPGGQPVVVLGHGFWRSAFGGERSVIGKTARIDDLERTIVGIAPSGFHGDSMTPVDVWIPYASTRAAAAPGWWQDRRQLSFELVGRLAVDADRAAQIALTAFQRGQEGFERADVRRTAIRLASLRGVPGATQAGQIALWLNGVALLVLLVATANVTNLFLVRAVRRRYEIAVRTALGMRTGRLVRQLLTESLFLSAIGGALGLVLASWGGDLARALLLPDLAASERIVDGTVLAASATASIACGLIAGLTPLAHSRTAALAKGLSGAGGIGAHPGARLRSLLLVGQTALSAVLLFGAALFVISLYRVQAQDLGFEIDRILLANPQFDSATSRAQRLDVYRRGTEALARIPGIEVAAPTTTLPFGPRIALLVEAPDLDGNPFEGKQLPYLNPVAPDYFKIMGMRVTEGRGIEPTDTREGALVTVISERMANALWPLQSALGKCLRITTGNAPAAELFPWAAQAALPCREVVGVVSNARRWSIRPEDESIMQYYVPAGQLQLELSDGEFGNADYWAWLVRTTGEPKARLATVQQTLQALGVELRFVDVRPYRDLTDPLIRPWRLGAAMFSLFGALAIGMAAVGTYSTLAYATDQRRREMGLRMALGARSANVLALVVRHALGTALVGVAIGSVGAWALAARLAPLLFETEAYNAPALLGVAVALLAAAILASLLPGRRATRTEPNVALRAD